VLQDHDGDGLTDLIYSTGSAIQWLHNLGGSFASAATLYTGTATVQWFGVGVEQALRSLDANGDGRADLLVGVLDCTGTPPVCTDDYHVLLADGSAYTPVSFAEDVADGYYADFQVGDFNGDGLGDLLYTAGADWVLRLSTGNGSFSSAVTGVPVAWKVLIADYDGDGRDDLLSADGDYWRVYRSLGTTFETSYSASIYASGFPGFTSNDAFMADVAGSGYPEIVYAHGGWSFQPRNSAINAHSRVTH
jgi:hypothetical protein